MRLAWVALAAFLLLVVAKAGLMHWRADAVGANTDALPFEAAQERAGAVAERTRPLWKPILL
ncbi:hypothetical protein [Sphingobium aromaticiconvertens]|uniref:hypothetical protein n=1 Tax=Sphingobium aromaticiconvertens TaxID=365341 RepID=UPI0030176A08